MFVLEHPWFLLGLPLPLLIWLFIPAAKSMVIAAINIPFYQQLVKFIGISQPLITRNMSIFVIIWLLMILALTDPRWVGSPLSLERNGHNIMLALDLSESMGLDDMLVNGRLFTRLSIVKNAATQFIIERTGDNIGLILFGSRAYLQTPLTYDHKTLLLRIDESEAGLAGPTTAIGDALGLAIKHLQDVPKKNRVIILLTDGVNNSGVLTPLKAAELAKNANIKIYTIGLGAKSNSHALNNAFLNVNLVAELDEKTLQKIANLTFGRYFRATDDKSLKEIYNIINKLETVKQQAVTLRPQITYYPWIVAAAWLLWIFWLIKETRP